MTSRNPRYPMATHKYPPKNYFTYFNYTYILNQYRLLDPCFARRLEALDLITKDLEEKANSREAITKTRSLPTVPHEKNLLILLAVSCAFYVVRLTTP